MDERWLFVEWIDSRNLFPEYDIINTSSLIEETPESELYVGNMLFFLYKSDNKARKAKILKVSEHNSYNIEHMKVIIDSQREMIEDFISSCMKFDKSISSSQDESALNNNKRCSRSVPDTEINEQSRNSTLCPNKTPRNLKMLLNQSAQTEGDIIFKPTPEQYLAFMESASHIEGTHSLLLSLLKSIQKLLKKIFRESVINTRLNNGQLSLHDQHAYLQSISSSQVVEGGKSEERQKNKISFPSTLKEQSAQTTSECLPSSSREITTEANCNNDFISILKEKLEHINNDSVFSKLNRLSTETNNNNFDTTLNKQSTTSDSLLSKSKDLSIKSNNNSLLTVTTEQSTQTTNNSLPSSSKELSAKNNNKSLSKSSKGRPAHNNNNSTNKSSKRRSAHNNNISSPAPSRELSAQDKNNSLPEVTLKELSTDITQNSLSSMSKGLSVQNNTSLSAISRGLASEKNNDNLPSTSNKSSAHNSSLSSTSKVSSARITKSRSSSTSSESQSHANESNSSSTWSESSTGSNKSNSSSTWSESTTDTNKSSSSSTSSDGDELITRGGCIVLAKGFRKIDWSRGSAAAPEFHKLVEKTRKHLEKRDKKRVYKRRRQSKKKRKTEKSCHLRI